MSPVCAIWTVRRVDPLLAEDPHLLRAGPAGRARVGHDRQAGLHRRAGGRPVHLLDVGRDARLVGGALDEGRLDPGALDSVLDLVDEDRRDAVLVAVEQNLREMVVGVDARREHNVEPALVGHALAERRVAREEQRARLDHRLDAVAPHGVGVRDRRLPLGLLVVQMRELEAPRLVGRPEVLVDQRQAELIDIHGPARGLNSGHARKPTASRALPAGAAPRARASSRAMTPTAVTISAITQAHDEDAVAPVLQHGEERERQRERDRQPPPATGRGVAEAKAGKEEEDVGDDHCERGSQDSNLGPPVLETGATSQLSYCPRGDLIVASSGAQLAHDPLRQERLADLHEALLAVDQLVPLERLERLLDRRRARQREAAPVARAQRVAGARASACSTLRCADDARPQSSVKCACSERSTSASASSTASTLAVLRPLRCQRK